MRKGTAMAAAQLCLDHPGAELNPYVTGDESRAAGVLTAASTLALD